MLAWVECVACESNNLDPVVVQEIKKGVGAGIPKRVMLQTKKAQGMSACGACGLEKN